MEQVRIVQHNVRKWTKTRANELTNLYRSYNPDIIFLNETGKKDTDKIKLYMYNVYQRNSSREEHAGVAIAVKKEY